MNARNLRLLFALTISLLIVTGTLTLLCLSAAQATPSVDGGGTIEPPAIPHVTATVPLSPGIGFEPVAIGVNPATGYVYVSNARSNDISILSDTQFITNVNVIGGPSTIAVNPATGYVYVALSTDDLAVLSGTQIVTTMPGVGGAVMRVNATTGFVYTAKPGGNVVTVLDGTYVVSTVTVESGLTNIGAAPNSSLVYVTAYLGSYPNYTGTLSVLSGTQFITTITGLVGEPQAVGVNPVNDYIYVANGFANTVTVLSGTQVITDVPIGQSCPGRARAIEVNPATGYVYVMRGDSPTCGLVAVLSDTNLVGTFTMGPPTAMTLNPANGNIYVTDALCYHCDMVGRYASTVYVLNGAQIIAWVDIEGDLSAVGANPNDGYIYVVNRGAGPVGPSIVILSDTQTIATVRGHGPMAIRVDPGNGRVYVADVGHKSVTIMQGLQITADVDMDIIPSSLTVNPATGLVYVVGSLYYTNVFSGAVAIMSDTQVITRLNVGSSPCAVEVNPANGYVYIPNMLSGSVSVLSGTQIITTVDVRTPLEYSGPFSVKADPANGYVYVGSDRSVSVLSGTQVITTIFTNDKYLRFIGVNPASGYVYVVGDTVSILHGTQVITTVTVTGSPSALGVGPASGYVYIAGYEGYPVNSGFVTILRGTQVITRMTIGTSVVWPGDTYAIAVSPLSGYVYIASSNGTVLVLNDTQVVETLSAGDYPSDVAVNPINGLVYVSNYYGRSITIITDPPARPYRAYLPVVGSMFRH